MIKQDQVKKCHSLVLATHIFIGVNGTPRVVAIVTLSNEANTWIVATKLAEALIDDVADFSEYGSWKLKYIMPFAASHFVAFLIFLC